MRHSSVYTMLYPLYVPHFQLFLFCICDTCFGSFFWPMSINILFVGLCFAVNSSPWLYLFFPIGLRHYANVMCTGVF